MTAHSSQSRKQQALQGNFEAARWLRENDTKAFIVFLSGYPEYSLEGYKVEAHRFLLKNDENLESSLAECLDSAIDKMQRDEKKIELAVQGGTLSIAPSKIVYRCRFFFRL